MVAQFWMITILSWVAGLAISFFLVRIAVRSDEQVSLLKAMNDKQTKQIDLLTQLLNGKAADVSNPSPADRHVKTDAEYLAEARAKAGM